MPRLAGERPNRPPYFGNVQYGELMDFCYVWLRRLAGSASEGFDRASTRSPDELTGNVTQDRGLDHFTAGLSAVYSRMAAALKPGAPLVFIYHHNKLEAYYAVGVAILDAGLVCSATLPCPAEMGGSIHIHGTASSIIDTVFVCRRSGAAPIRWMFDTPDQLATITEEDSALLATTGRSPTCGDTRCIVFGHLTRMAVWKLRKSWGRALPVKKKFTAFADAVSAYGDPDRIAEHVVAAHRNRTTDRIPKTSTGSPRTSGRGATPRPGAAGAAMRPRIRCGAPAAMLTVT